MRYSEPWSFGTNGKGELVVADADGETVYKTNMPVERDYVAARRICSAVNACQKLSNAALNRNTVDDHLIICKEVYSKLDAIIRKGTLAGHAIEDELAAELTFLLLAITKSTLTGDE